MTAGRLRSLDDIAFCDDLHQMQMILIDCEEVFDQGDADLDQHFQRLRKILNRVCPEPRRKSSAELIVFPGGKENR